MKAFAITLATVAAFAAPAAAQQVPTGTLGAIAHFNKDHDSQDDRVVIVPGGGAGLSTRSGGFSEAQARFNRDFDSQDDVRRVRGGAVFSGTPGSTARAQGIFARIRAESLMDE